MKYGFTKMTCVFTSENSNHLTSHSPKSQSISTIRLISKSSYTFYSILHMTKLHSISHGWGAFPSVKKKIVPLTPSLELHRLCRRLQKELKRKSQAKAIDVSSVKYRQESRERHLQRWLNFYAMYIYTTIEANVLGQKENRLQNIVNHRRRIHPTQVFQCKVSWEHLFYCEHDNRKDDRFI